jgi:hypothetical protein
MRKRKRNRKPRVEVPLELEEDAELERIAIELEMSRAEVMKLALTAEGRELLAQAEERIKTLHPYQQAQALQDTNVPARARRHDKYERSKVEKKAQERDAHAKDLLREGRTLYQVSAATGLPQSEVIRLSRERLAEDETATREALREREQALDKEGPGAGRDELAKRIGLLREEEDDEESGGQYSSLRELNVDALSRLFY